MGKILKKLEEWSAKEGYKIGARSCKNVSKRGRVAKVET